jgi:hypothetical protein
MFVAWGVTGREAFRRTRCVGQAAIAGGTVAFATFIVFTIIVVLRMNLTLDTIVERPDWRTWSRTIAAATSTAFAPTPTTFT